MKFFDYVFIVVFVLIFCAFCTGKADAKEATSRYIGEIGGVRIYLVCVNGAWLAFSIKPGSDFHILAPHILDGGIGVELPACKEKEEPK